MVEVYSLVNYIAVSQSAYYIKVIYYIINYY